MDSGLRKLMALQNIDLQIAELAKRAQNIPAEVRAIDQMLEQNQLELERLRQRVEEYGKTRRSIEGETELLRQKLAKFKDQLMSVKTNKEYQAVLHEISLAEQEISRAEDRILEAMLAADEAASEASGIEKDLHDHGREIQDRRRELLDFQASSEGEIERLRSQRAAVAAEVPEDLMGLYARIASARNGLAMAEARDQSCQICHVRMRPQLFNELKTNQRIVTCESCNRILYFSPD